MMTRSRARQWTSTETPSNDVQRIKRGKDKKKSSKWTHQQKMNFSQSGDIYYQRPYRHFVSTHPTLQEDSSDSDSTSDFTSDIESDPHLPTDPDSDPDTLTESSEDTGGESDDDTEVEGAGYVTPEAGNSPTKIKQIDQANTLAPKKGRPISIPDRGKTHHIQGPVFDEPSLEPTKATGTKPKVLQEFSKFVLGPKPGARQKTTTKQTETTEAPLRGTRANLKAPPIGPLPDRPLEYRTRTKQPPRK
jgi:hypothetical protein